MNIYVFKKSLIKIVLIQLELYLLLNLVFIILLNDYTSISYISIASILYIFFLLLFFFAHFCGIC